MRETLVQQALSQGAQSYVDAIARLPTSLVGMRAKVAQIGISPVKSLAMMPLTRADVRQTGLTIPAWKDIGDRQVMIVRRKPGSIHGKQYNFVRFSQREAPYLVLARQSFSHGEVRLEAPGIHPQTFKYSDFLPRPGDTSTVLMSLKSQEIVPCVRGLNTLTLWVRALINKYDPSFPAHEIEVVARPIFDKRRVDPMHACGLDACTGFSDGGMITVASQTSLDLVNAERPGRRPITPEALRMNIVLDGLLPYAEDVIGSVVIRPESEKPLTLHFGGLCVRCSVPCVNPDNPQEVDTDFLRWLGANRPFRPDPDPTKKASGVTFGVNCAVGIGDGHSYINVGDMVEVVSEK